MKSVIGLLLVGATLAACNSVYVRPNSMVRGEKVHALFGGYAMRRSIKERLADRGYDVIVGKIQQTRESTNSEGDIIEIDSYRIPDDVRYSVNVRERREIFNPLWCPLNGFWWWNFSVSIMDRQDGTELMTWRGRGCATSSLRKLDKILDMMEIKDDTNNATDNGDS